MRLWTRYLAFWAPWFERQNNTGCEHRATMMLLSWLWQSWAVSKEHRATMRLWPWQPHLPPTSECFGEGFLPSPQDKQLLFHGRGPVNEWMNEWANEWINRHLITYFQRALQKRTLQCGSITRGTSHGCSKQILFLTPMCNQNFLWSCLAQQSGWISPICSPIATYKIITQSLILITNCMVYGFSFLLPSSFILN